MAESLQVEEKHSVLLASRQRCHRAADSRGEVGDFRRLGYPPRQQETIDRAVYPQPISEGARRRSADLPGRAGEPLLRLVGLPEAVTNGLGHRRVAREEGGETAHWIGVDAGRTLGRDQRLESRQ